MRADLMEANKCLEEYRTQSVADLHRLEEEKELLAKAAEQSASEYSDSTFADANDKSTDEDQEENSPSLGFDNMADDPIAVVEVQQQNMTTAVIGAVQIEGKEVTSKTSVTEHNFLDKGSSDKQNLGDVDGESKEEDILKDTGKRAPTSPVDVDRKLKQVNKEKGTFEVNARYLFRNKKKKTQTYDGTVVKFDDDSVHLELTGSKTKKIFRKKEIFNWCYDKVDE